ncbi:MAG TPA: beta-ketoacyl synthase N-terminal-like domain-containing protein, partial [Candidatus Binatia bacterium]|nr:beta-ketoacyl synthase N-terminal-like domain-containing protein [Candidatus Binatia bacterium]
MRSDDYQKRRVVVTGMGVIAANGKDLSTFWNAIRSGISAAAPVTRFDTTGAPTRIAAEVNGLDASRYMDPKTARRLDRSLQYTVSAARLAMEHSKIDFSKFDPDRTGVVEGTSVSSNEAAHKTEEAYLKKGYRGVNPFALINGYCGAGCGEIAHELGIKGHAISCSSGSASGNDAIGYAISMIQNDE